MKPHFLLIRQNLRDGNENYKKLLLGFRYSGVGSVNSIESIYNFQVSFISPLTALLDCISLTKDKPWVYAHLLEIQRRLGKESFPLIDQSFYPTHTDMVLIITTGCSLVLKLGRLGSQRSLPVCL